MFLPTCARDLPSPGSIRMSKALLKTLSSKASSDAPDLWVAATILFSAGTYFFDYGSNIATAWKYHALEYRNQSSDVRFHPESPKSEFPGIFPGIVAVMIIAHVVNALIFYLHLDSSKEALKCAYLLPVIYLRKLSLLIWRTGNLQGARDLRSSEMDAIYNILAAALETGPQLILQFHVFAELGYLSPEGTRAPTVLVLSIAASFLSGAYNGGQAMVGTTDKVTPMGRTAIGVTGGLHIVSALLVRSIAFELITEEGFYHSSSPFRYYYFYLALVIIVPCAAFWILLRPHHRQQQESQQGSQESQQEQEEQRSPAWKIALKCISFAYVSITLGPLYPLSSHAKQIKQPRRDFRARLLKSCLLHLGLDLVVIIFVCGGHGRTWLTPCYLQWSRDRDRRIHNRFFPQSFMSCSAFQVLLVLSLVFYVVTIVAFVLLDAYTDIRLEKKISEISFPAEEQPDFESRGSKHNSNNRESNSSSLPSIQ